MFKKFKLMATAVGLVAVLVGLMAMPGVTQQNPLARSSIVSAINSALAATLTAAEGDIFDTDNAKFYSDTYVTFAYIPLHPSSRSYQLFDPQELLAGKTVNVTIAALFLPGPDNGCDLCPPIFNLSAGTYRLKVVDRTKYVLVDQAGKEVRSGQLQVEPAAGRPVPSWGLTMKSTPTGPGTVVLSGWIEAHIKCIHIIIEW